MSLKAKLKSVKPKTQLPHLIIMARAGTGKTTTLVSALHNMRGDKPSIEPSEQQQAIWDSIALSKDASSVCFCCFNKSIQKELAKRVPKGCDASTMHSLGNKAVTKAYGRLRIETSRTEILLSELMEMDIWDLRKKHKEFLRACITIVGLCKMNLLEGTEDDVDFITSYYEVETNGCMDKLYEWVPQVLERAKDPTKDQSMDFNDMIWLPIVNNLPMTKYDLLLVDEAQDLNKCQQAIAKRSGKRLIFCGDDKQAIYGFAGADSQSLHNLQDELGNVEVLPLTVTRRCGKAIVAEAQKYVVDFEAHESNAEGSIRFSSYKGEGEHDNDEGASPEQVCYHRFVEDGDMLLCRVNSPLVQQCFKFLKQGRKANIQGRDIGKGLISTIKKLNSQDVVDLAAKLDIWHRLEVSKENAKKFPSETKILSLDDRYDCLNAFMEGCTTVDEVIEKIQSVFTDDETDGILFSSVHKAKGLEANRVFLLQPEGATIPHPMAKSVWQKEQEYNILYVAITRAIQELVYVS